MPRYEITTSADGRKNTRRNWTIEATSVDEACYQARQNHLTSQRRWSADTSILVKVHGWRRDHRTGQWVEAA